MGLFEETSKIKSQDYQQMKTKPLSYDQDKAKHLRMSIIQAAQDILDEKKSVKKWSQLKKELILRMSPRVLPVLNAGKDDDKDLFPNPILCGQTKTNGLPTDAGADQAVGDAKENQGC